MADEQQKEVRVKSTPAFKLKDKVGRNWQAIHLEKQFGFIPDVIIIEKVHGQNNHLIVRAVLTEEQMEIEDLARQKAEIEKNKALQSSRKAGKKV